MKKVMTSRFKSEALWRNLAGAAVLSSSLEYITKWEHGAGVVGFISATTAVGFRVTLSSMLSLLEYVTKELHYNYLMTTNLSQDPDENLLGIVRQSSGCNNNPTPQYFLITLNCLTFYSLAREVTGSSLDPGVLTALLDTGDTCSESTSLEDTIDKLIAQGDHDSLGDTVSQEQAIPVNHNGLVQKKSDSGMVYHMAGYVAKKCVEKSGCDTCRASCLFLLQKVGHTSSLLLQVFVIRVDCCIHRPSCLTLSTT
ncbi:hypothetical protein HPB48_026420 [Haemaphysalis longicornis]|uniref:Transposable element P transposase-like RNase H C-terminal domain-containing protein n=1 Tax=Haemaphysalis longicornis TaxID=44386 RepID=A0A9J6H9H4_HAELO|nr:hypothetical protein HPB48_026420 [Haemaphysalis longicornis]